MARIMTLGEFEQALAEMPQDEDICFDFCYFRPTTLHSYRGFYDHLAFGYQQDANPCTVKDVLDRCREANGKVFQGYKGGDYPMHDGTPLWVANVGESGGTAIVGVDRCDVQVTIRTAFIDF